jgi:hypothetical protein
MLWELVYNSVAFPRELPEADLAAMIDAARINNARLGLSGILLHHGGEYVQLLEGEQSMVQEMYYGRIAHDKRHRGARVSWEYPIGVRSFSTWSMGLVDAREVAGLDVPGIDGLIEHGVRTLDLSGPGSIGRRVLIATYEAMTAKQPRACA